MRRISLLFCCGILAACSTGVSHSGYGGPIKIADSEMVKGCTLLTDVRATSPFYGVFAGPALADARVKALREAEDNGATHVVWTVGDSGYGSTSVQGLAYRCPPRPRT